MKHSIPVLPIATATGVNQRVKFNRRIPWRQRLISLGDYLLRLFSGGNTPHVQQHIDRAGELSWSVYDPYSQVTYQFDSDKAVRIWLEQRYYQ